MDFLLILFVCTIFGIANAAYVCYEISKIKKELKLEKTVTDLLDICKNKNTMTETEIKRKIENTLQ